MTEQQEPRFTQYLALALIVIGLVSMALGSHFHWSDLSTAAAGVVGGGLGIITNGNKSNASVTKADSVTIDASTGAKGA